MNQDPFPRATSELTCHFLPTHSNIFTCATITVDLTPANAECVSAGGSSIHSALLLTLSPLHTVAAVRVLVQKKGGGKIDQSKVEWHQLPLDSSIFYPTKQRIVSGAMRQQPGSLAAVSSPNEDVKKEVEEKGYENDELGSEAEVLELVFGSSGDERDASTDGELLPSTPQHVGGEKEDDMARQFLLRLCPLSVEGIDTEEGSGTLCILQCCIDVVIVPSTELVGMSFPFLTVMSTVGCSQSVSEAAVGVNSEDRYMLFAGQRFYDYFISPRVAYTKAFYDNASFTSINVLIVALHVVQDDGMNPWEIVPLTSLPVLPENLFCAFVRPMLGSSSSSGVESHAGVKWRVQHHPAYTFMSTLDEEGEMSEAMRLYFFHCDHILCECLLPLTQIANTAWEAVCSSRTAYTVPRSDATTWVVTSSTNTLLRLRRGALCVHGGVLLTTDVLRAVWSSDALTVNSNVDALRAKVLLFSLALEMKWRGAAAAEGTTVPEFNATPSGAGQTRAWAFCLCCDEPGWTELLEQERRLAACDLYTVSQTDPWSLMQRYICEVRQTLLFLSSASAVISIRRQGCYPWEVMEKQNDTLLFKWIAEMNSTFLNGMHLEFVRLLLQQEWKGQQSDAAFVPIPLRASLSYEVRDIPTAVYRDILLYIRFPKMERTRGPIGSNNTLTETIWGIDIPFTLLDFTVEGAETSLLAVPAPTRKEHALYCHVAQTIPGYWRVSGLAWVRGLEQQTTFSILQGETKTDADEKKNNTNLEVEGNGNEDTDDDKKRFLVQMPLLVLNPKVIPAALLVRVEHNQFWSNLSTPIDIHTRRAVLEHVMEQAVQEGETAKMEESKLVFTPLLNQLLESLLDGGLPQQEEHSFSLKATKTTALSLFFTALRNVHVDEKSVWRQVYADTHARFSYYLSRHHFPSLQLVGEEKQEKREDIKRGQRYDHSSSANDSSRNISEVERRLLQHLRAITSYYDSLPPTEAQLREQYQQRQRPRLMLSLRGKTPQIRKENEEDEEEKTRKKQRKERNFPSNPTELVEIISRVLVETSKCKDDDDDNAALSVRKAALSLSIPLGLLLQGSPELLRGQKGRTLLKAQELCDTLRTAAATASGGTDTFLLKAYEGFYTKH